MTTEQDHPIQWKTPIKEYDMVGPDHEEWCLWRDYGMTSPEKCLELFGHEGELQYDDGEILIIGDILYTPYNLRETKEKVEDGPENGHFDLNEISEIRHPDTLDQDKLKLLRQFAKDLTDYYERMDSGDWSDIPNWREDSTIGAAIVVKKRTVKIG